MQPLITPSPAATSLGIDSPVRAEVSILEFPSSTIPSRGIRSPGFITVMLPISTSSGAVEIICPFISTFAKSGRISINAAMDFLELPTA